MKSLPLLLLLCVACIPPAPTPTGPMRTDRLAALEERVRAIIRTHAADTAEVSVALLDLATGDSLLIAARTPMHAASTMKVPVMIELFRLADAGEVSLDHEVLLRNEFRSIADGSTFAIGTDSDSTLYARLGKRVPLRELIERMITRSSNLATNTLFEFADPARIEATLREFDAQEMRVVRGVEDLAAFERGLNNSTTAYGYLKVLAALASGRATSPAATREMLEVLARQEFAEMIPAGLPHGVRFASKSGWITRIDHDGAIVFPPGQPPYVLVVLTRGFRDRRVAHTVGREISSTVYQFLVR